ncbi:MAG: nitrate reductase [Desulfatitalea sp. BRH_c12]|nr:MAG: nitrate reductase [Desulfatitalea sp. BRH_c12]
MDLWYTFIFTVFPYVCLTTFVVGHAYRYVTDRFGWNARSSEFLNKKGLWAGSVLFHVGIILTVFGHAGGLLIPQSVFDLFGIDAQGHMAIAYWSGLAVGVAAFAGVLLLGWRRLNQPRLKIVTTRNDAITLAGLVVVIGIGLFNVVFGHFNVLYSVAPWIRGIITFTPDATLMKAVPLGYQLHVIAAWALLAFSPFSRLVHIWSAPLFYFFRPPIVFRRRLRQF